MTSTFYIDQSIQHFRSSARPNIEIVYANKLPNCPGKSCIGFIVTFPPKSRTPPHRHAGASVSALVLNGTVLNKMNDGPTRVFSKGGTFFEAPGCHHKVSDNASDTEEALLLASLVVDTEVFERGGVQALMEIDEEFV
jgi:quercetin dioxygenase-like cupin family protein